MIKSRLLNIWLIANLGMVWLVPQPSLAFSLFGPSDAEKQILFLQGYNAGVARVTATDGITELAPVNANTNIPKTGSAAAASSNAYVTNPLSGDLNLNQWTIYNGNVHLNSETTGYNPLSVGAFGARAVAFRAAATNTDAYAGIFTGKVDINGGLRAANLLVGDFGQEISADIPIMGIGVNSGVVGTAMGWTEGHGVTGNGFYGVAGFASQNNGAGIYGKVVSGIENAYAGLFDGQVKINNGGLIIDHGTIKVNNASDSNGILSTVLVNGGTAIRGVATAEDSLAGAFVGRVEAQSTGTAIKGTSNSQEGGYGIYGLGHTGVIGIANYPGGIGIYGQAYAGELAGKFDGEVNIMSGNLRFTNNLNPRIDVNTNVASTLAINFAYDQSNSNPGDDFGINNLGDFVFNSNNRLGIGTSNPNANLHVKTSNNNAEIDIQSGSNQHWGIYQNMTGGALNFWHGDNRLTINDKGITTNGICIGKTCITKWEDLKAILNTTTPLPTKTGVTPAQQ